MGLQCHFLQELPLKPLWIKFKKRHFCRKVGKKIMYWRMKTFFSPSGMIIKLLFHNLLHIFLEWWCQEKCWPNIVFLIENCKKKVQVDLLISRITTCTPKLILTLQVPWSWPRTENWIDTRVGTDRLKPQRKFCSSGTCARLICLVQGKPPKWGTLPYKPQLA